MSIGKDNKISEDKKTNLTLPSLFCLGFFFGKGNAYYYDSEEKEIKRYTKYGRSVVKEYYGKTEGEEDA